ncbi:MAG: hypothetical protein Q9M10_08065, partial [Mariprofundaceae bacterium]|nr:hypothetical protein [Mariprofundaceae bacterium]
MFVLRLLIVGGLLASCGGGNGSVTPAQVGVTATQAIVNKGVSLSGVVVDGYMQGATVFVDRNNNGVHDATEPFAVTDPLGAFQLTGLKLGDENYPVVADVPATAMDSDTRRAVGQHSIMNAPAPGILTQSVVISPITTLIKTVMDSTPNSDKYTAAQSIKKDLALPANSNVDLFANYMTLETKSADYAKVHRVAQVVARTVARQADAVHQSALKSNTNATFSDAISLITTQVVNQLPVIEKAIPVGTPSVVGVAWDAYAQSIAVADSYTSPINLADTYTFNPAVSHQIQLTAAATQKAQALAAKTSIQAALVLQDAYVQVVAQDAYSLALAMQKAPKITQAQRSVAIQSLTAASANQSAVLVASSPVITLKGANPLTVAQGSVYADAGATVTDNVDKGLIAKVT